MKKKLCRLQERQIVTVWKEKVTHASTIYINNLHLQNLHVSLAFITLNQTKKNIVAKTATVKH